MIHPAIDHTLRDALRLAPPSNFARLCELPVGPGWVALVDVRCMADNAS